MSEREDPTPERLAEIAARSQAMAEGAARFRAEQEAWTRAELERLGRLGLRPMAAP
jgi:hypothetical protein